MLEITVRTIVLFQASASKRSLRHGNLRAPLHPTAPPVLFYIRIVLAFLIFITSFTLHSTSAHSHLRYGRNAGFKKENNAANASEYRRISKAQTDLKRH